MATYIQYIDSIHQPKNVLIQQDNATVHILPSKFKELLHLSKIDTKELNILTYMQPSNSPNLNILDLGIFPSLQSKYYADPPTNIPNLLNKLKRLITNSSMKRLMQLSCPYNLL